MSNRYVVLSRCILCACLFSTVALSSENSNSAPMKTAPTDMSTKIQAFLDKESKNLSKDCPFVLHLFKDGIIAKNKAGLRISETSKQFPGIQKLPGEELSGSSFTITCMINLNVFRIGMPMP